MKTRGLAGGAYQLCEWITRLAWLNMLWIFFTLSGLVVLGFMPASMAMLAIIRKWLKGDTGVSVLPTFWQYYKRDFLKSNGLGLILFITGFALRYYLQLFQAGSSPLDFFFYSLTLIISFLSLLVLPYVFSVFVHYDLSLLKGIRSAFLVMLTNFLTTAFMALSGFLVYRLLLAFPGLVPFFGASLFAIVMMWFTLRTFNHIERRKSYG